MNQLSHQAISHADTAAKGPLAASIRSADPRERPLGILIVDDDQGVRRMINTGLKLYGFTTWTAADAVEAVEIYRLHAKSVDLVLLDVLMPSRDGPATLAALREVDHQIRVCFMTGNSGRYSEIELHDLGAVAVFRKPFGPRELARQLAELAAPVDPYSPRADLNPDKFRLIPRLNRSIGTPDLTEMANVRNAE